MNRLGRLAAGGALALLAVLRPAAADPAADTSTWQLSLRSAHHSDALPLAALGDDDWQRLVPRRGRNLAYVDDELRLSRQQGGWTWSLLARSQATLVASDESLALAALVDAGARPAGDRRWQADVRLRGFSGTGLALGQQQPLAAALAPGWSLRWEAQALALGRWRERRLAGPVRFDAADARYHFALQSSEIDNRLELPFQAPVARRGAALLLAAELAWEGQAAWARAGLHDGGWLHWRGLPQQLATLDTATRSVDADGFLLYQPLVQGRNRQSSSVAWLPWRGTLAVGGKLAGGQRLGLQLQTLPGWGVLPSLQWQWPAAAPGQLALGAQWRLHERRLDLDLAWRGLSLSVGADRLDGSAQSRKLSLGWTLRL